MLNAFQQQLYYFYPDNSPSGVGFSGGDCSSCGVDVSRPVTSDLPAWRKCGAGSCSVKKPSVQNSLANSVSQRGGAGSDYQGLFHAVSMNPRELSIITSRYIDQSPMFNPLRFNTVIPTIYNGIVPTGAYLLNDLPTTPAQLKSFGNRDLMQTASDIHCQCQKHGVKLYDEVDGKLVPRNTATLLQKLQQATCS
jgi:hypothetical protein